MPVRVAVTKLPGADDVPLPAYASEGAAGLDLRAVVEKELLLPPGDRALVPTGLAIAVPPGYEAQVRPRSGLALRHGIVLPNSPGTIDSDYRGELQVIVCNTGAEPFAIQRGDRIAQLVLAPVARLEWDQVDDVDELPGSERGRGGFGSTGGE